MPRSLLVVDGNAPWVRSLVAAITTTTRVTTLRVYTPPAFRAQHYPLTSLLSHRPAADHTALLDRPIVLPGWTRFPRLSAFLLIRAIRHAIRRHDVDAILYTLPHYAPAATHFRGRLIQAYFAFDPYLFYDWDKATTTRNETALLRDTDVTFAISRLLAEDLRHIAPPGRPIHQLPNAASPDFVAAAANTPPCPPDLAALPRPIVGCTGQMNASYDWPLIARLANALPDATFCFIGPIFDEPRPVRAPMDAALALPNVRHLGPRPHAQLPAYQQHFDVCLNPLRVNDHNNRRDTLRSYDYLCTAAPIVSTPLAEMPRFTPHIHTTDGEAMINLLRQALAGQLPPDLPARQAFLQQNTWPARAAQLVSTLATINPQLATPSP